MSKEVRDTAHKGASMLAKEFASWFPRQGSADTDLNPELGSLVSRSRDLVHNHGIASGVTQTIIDNVVGGRFSLCATLDYRALRRDKAWTDEWSREVECEWRSWAETKECDATRSLTFAGLTAQVFRSSLVNGEALALPLWMPERTFATVLQLVEPDRLSNPDDREDTKNLRGGIEIDTYGAPIAYHILENHPGENVFEQKIWTRIPATMTFGRARVYKYYT